MHQLVGFEIEGPVSRAVKEGDALLLAVHEALDAVIAADALVPGLGIIFKTSFLAVVLKYVNDTLWGTIVLVLIRKRLPSHDTAKFLSLFWFIVWLTSSFGPLIGGIISESTSILYLFVGVLILNLFILGAIAKYDLATEGTLYEEGVQR